MEHLQHFGLTQDPFSNEPDLRFFFESGSHRDAQRRVERGLRQHKGLTLLTGDGGMGKGEAESCISNCPSLRLSPRPFLLTPRDSNRQIG